MKYSTTYAATLVVILLNFIGFEVSEAEVTEILTLIGTLVAAIWILIERYKKGGVNKLGIRD